MDEGEGLQKSLFTRGYCSQRVTVAERLIVAKID
jgi:hypothetical protein